MAVTWLRHGARKAAMVAVVYVAVDGATATWGRADAEGKEVAWRIVTTDLSDFCFFFQAEDGIRDYKVTGVQTCALPICRHCCRTTGAPCCWSGARPTSRPSPWRPPNPWRRDAPSATGPSCRVPATGCSTKDRKSVV